MKLLIIIIVLLSISGCANVYDVRSLNQPGHSSTYVDPGSSGSQQGVGIESQDIVGMTDRMVRDILADTTFATKKTPPRVVIDAAYFRNESSSIINTNLITDLLRSELARAATGRMIFLGREYAKMVEVERELENNGVVSSGTQGSTQKAYGWDYRLGGRIASLDTLDSKSGRVTRYTQITFEMVERGSGQIIWIGTYKFKKTAQDDILYR